MAFVARCTHCGQAMFDGVATLDKAEVRRLREHLLGCPAAVSAFAPAMPLPRTRDDLLKHFIIKELRRR